jgi:phage replication-related protein YjqB (UPF0714/DUF867 family)
MFGINCCLGYTIKQDELRLKLLPETLHHLHGIYFDINQCLQYISKHDILGIELIQKYHIKIV